MKVVACGAHVLNKCPTHACLVSKGFKDSLTENTLYVKHCDGVFLVVTLYVDDLMVTENDE